jgi:hypothetical protein
MASSLAPRVVFVTRETELDALLARHGTRGQVTFALESRGQSFSIVEARDTAQRKALAFAKTRVPPDWSITQVRREDLNRFLFFPNDIVVALGQDGLVANLAKYLSGQPVIGVTPDARASEGVLTRHAPDVLDGLLVRTAAGDIDVEARTMAEARVQGGDRLTALNDLFIGHRSHQSARYDLRHQAAEEYQSSSGLIVATGTGLSGWAKSIMAATGTQIEFPPNEPRAAFFAREPWPSQTSSAELRSGVIHNDQPLSMTSRINEGGVIFADGIEQDFLSFDWGTEVEFGIADATLSLVA